MAVFCQDRTDSERCINHSGDRYNNTIDFCLDQARFNGVEGGGLHLPDDAWDLTGARKEGAEAGRDQTVAQWSDQEDMVQNKVQKSL